MTMPLGRQLESGPLSRAISAEIRAALARTRTPAAQLSASMGVSSSYLSNRLRDKMPFTLNDVEAVSKALKLNLVDFVTTAAQQAAQDVR